MCASARSPTLPFAIRCTWEASSKLQEISALFFFPEIPQKPYLSLIFFSASDSPQTQPRSPLMTVVGFLMCSLCSVSGNEQRSIIHGSPLALTSETVIRSCLDSCYWNTYYLLQRRYIFALALSINSSDLKSITRTLPMLVLFIIYISCFCSDITAWNFDLCSLKPSAQLTSPHLTSSRSSSDSQLFFHHSTVLPSPTFPLYGTLPLLPASPSAPLQLSFAHFFPPATHSALPLCMCTFLILSYSPSASFFWLLLTHPHQDELHFQVPLHVRNFSVAQKKKCRGGFTVNRTSSTGQ